MSNTIDRFDRARLYTVLDALHDTRWRIDTLLAGILDPATRRRLVRDLTRIHEELALITDGHLFIIITTTTTASGEHEYRGGGRDA